MTISDEKHEEHHETWEEIAPSVIGFFKAHEESKEQRARDIKKIRETALGAFVVAIMSALWWVGKVVYTHLF